jgi:hypothetical protein
MQNTLRLAILTVVVLTSVAARAWSQEGEPRLWTDSTGKFRVRAVLIERTASTVRLHTADGREIEVPIERLSEADRGYLDALNAPADNPFSGGMPIPANGSSGSTSASSIPGTLRSNPESRSAGDEMALPGTGTTIDLSMSGADEPFVPDPLANVPAVGAKVVSVSTVDAYDKVWGPVPANLVEGRLLVSIGRNKSGSPEETRGRIYVADLTSGESTLVWDHASAVRVLDHDSQSGRTLIVDNLDQFQRGGELVMVEGLVQGKAQPLYRRTLPGAGKPGFAPQVEWAKLVSGSHVAAIVDGVLYLWDLPAAKLVYRIEKVNARTPPVFSGNQVYMAIPQSGAAVIVETSSGKVRRSLTTGSTLNPGIAFHPGGRALAVCFSNQYQVWDCVANEVLNAATTTAHLGAHPILWIAPKMFRTELGDAIHLDLGMSIWKYSASASTEPILVGDKMMVATTSQNCAVVSVEIPHSSANKSLNELTRLGDRAMLVRKGSTVAIAVESNVEVNQAEIRASLSEAAERAGWKVSNRGPITLVAKIGRGETQQLKFRKMGSPLGSYSTANLTPFTAELEIRRGADVLWERSTVNRIPPLLRLEEGETVQDAVKRYEKPDPSFFSRLTLPPRIAKPEISQKVGMSVLKDGQWQDLNVSPRPRSR